MSLNRDCPNLLCHIGMRRIIAKITQIYLTTQDS
jgi:hypothetical protein